MIFQDTPIKRETNSIRFKNAFSEIISEFKKHTEFNNKNSESCFEALKGYAADRELLILTKDPNANVKVYAFKALYQRNYSGIKDVFKNHLNDKQIIFIHVGLSEPGGSVSYTATKYINLFFLKIITPKLTQNEIKEYKEKISKSFTVEEWERVSNENSILDQFDMACI